MHSIHLSCMHCSGMEQGLTTVWLAPMSRPCALLAEPFLRPTVHPPTCLQGTAVPTEPPPYCHDMVTLLPEPLPLAAWTSGCSAAVAISPASSLLVYGSGALTEGQLKAQLGIDAAIRVGQFDAFKASAWVL